MDRRALWFAIGLGCATGLGLILVVTISNAVRGNDSAVIVTLLSIAVPLALMAGYGLGKGRN